MCPPIAAVLQGVADRMLAIEEGAALADILERHDTIIKNDAIERRLKALGSRSKASRLI
jgi:hypothetical protein